MSRGIRHAPDLFRPEYTLAPGRDRADAFVDEFLHALSFVSFGGVKVALRIGRDAVHSVELAGLAPAVAEVRQFRQRFAQYDTHLFVLAIGEKQRERLFIGGEEVQL